MIGWVRIGAGSRWHQVESTVVRGTDHFAFPLCDPDNSYPIDGEVLDYRWRPPYGAQCRRPACQQPVEP